MNPALPSGVQGIALTTRARAWSFTAQWVGGWVPFPARVADNRPIEDPTRSRLDLGLVTLLAAVGRGEGPGFELQLPLGFITRYDVVNGRNVDSGPGDLEARGRYLLPLGPLRLAAGVGAALPTGRYAARSGELGLLENARYLTLGRGVTWALADLDARVDLPRRFSVSASGTVRVPLLDARDGFRWGPEVRATVSAGCGPLAGRVAAAVGFEVQWRAQSSEIDLFTTRRTPSINTGGTWLTVTPSVQLRVLDGLVVFAAGRIPITQWVQGLQFVPGPGLFAGLAGAWELWSPPARAATPAAGAVTLVDYWASWCEPCTRLERLIAAAAARHPAVVIERVDASEWTSEDLSDALSGARWLPVVEIYDSRGQLVRRLEGEAAFGFEAVLDETP